jgi:hypothetical protein
MTPPDRSEAAVFLILMAIFISVTALFFISLRLIP